MRSLRALTAAFLLLFAAITVLTGYVTYTASRRAMEDLVEARIAAVSDAALEGVAPGDAVAILARVDALSRRRETGDIGFELIDARGRRIGGTVTLPRRLAAGYSRLHGDDRIAGLSAGRALVRDAGGGLRLTVVAETEPVDGYAGIRLRNYLLAFGAIALVVIAGTALFGSLVRHRIGEVRAAAEAIAAGDLSRRIPVSPGGDAFAEQAAAFNRMLDRIGALMDSLRHVSGDVAHDLRTPLARLRSRLAALAARDTVASDDVVAAVEDCDALLAMFAAILRIAEVEGGDRRAGFDRVDLAEVAREIVDTLTPLAAEEGRELSASLAPAAVSGDRRLIVQALVNLVENALRHTPPGTAIRVAVTTDAHGATIRVEDRGPGIAEPDRALALRRFGRLDASRHRPGHGLGLPLVEAIARTHGGTLVLGDARPGLAATIVIPRA